MLAFPEKLKDGHCEHGRLHLRKGYIAEAYVSYIMHRVLIELGCILLGAAAHLVGDYSVEQYRIDWDIRPWS